MRKEKKFATVAQMVKAVSEDPAFPEAFANRVAERQIIKFLISLRALADRSQKDVAVAMKCTQSRISKLESGKDGDLRLEDFSGFLAALGYDMKIVVGKHQQTVLDDVKYHAFSIKRILDHLGHLAGEDETMTRGVLKAIGETWYNLAKMLQDPIQTLALRPKGPGGVIAIEMQEVATDLQECEEICPSPSPSPPPQKCEIQR